MDLADIWQEVPSSNTSAREKAQELLLQRAAFDLNKQEWRELLAGTPLDVRREIGILMSAGTRLQLHIYICAARLLSSSCTLA